MFSVPEVLAGVRRAVGFALVHDGGESSTERTVTDVGVAHHPAHVRGRPPHVVTGHAVDG